MEPNECQFASLQSIAEGNAPMPRPTLFKLLKRVAKNILSENNYIAIRDYYRSLKDLFSKPRFEKPAANTQTQPLKAGDRVRVRSLKEIKAMLDNQGKTKGCGFTDAQEIYCGTVQRVLKAMEQFVDERDYRLKKCKGLILLEGVTCNGVKEFGRCDRACLMFWREEWLEKI